jgi:hypothetical protein
LRDDLRPQQGHPAAAFTFAKKCSSASMVNSTLAILTRRASYKFWFLSSNAVFHLCKTTEKYFFLHISWISWLFFDGKIAY